MTSSRVEPWINELLFIHFFSWRAELKEKNELLFLFFPPSFYILSLAVSWRIFIAATPCWFLNVNSSSAAVPDLRVQLLCRLRVSHWTQISWSEQSQRKKKKDSEREKERKTEIATTRFYRLSRYHLIISIFSTVCFYSK